MTYRLFVAVELPDEVRAALTRVQSGLRGLPNMRWEPPEKLHITLCFLGRTAEELVEPIVGALRTVPTRVPPRIALAGVVGAPHAHSPRMIWATLRGDLAGLNRLRNAVVHAFEPLGIIGESRAFNAHITLGRIDRNANDRDRRAIGQRLVAHAPEIAGEWSVGTIALFRSISVSGGARYECLEVIRL